MPTRTGYPVPDVLTFEMEELMALPGFGRAGSDVSLSCAGSTFDGRPTLLILDDAGCFWDDPLFASRIREWLKTLRRRMLPWSSRLSR